jgi:peptidyl-prolyl cis-trans isomerase D
MIRFLQTPGPLKKILLGGLLLVICVMMVVTLVPGGILGDSMSQNPQTLAKVGSQEVTIQEADKMARQMGRQQFPRGFPQQLLPLFMKNAVDTLIMQKAVVSEAGRMGLSVSDEELRYELQHGPISTQLFPNGTFIGDDAYQSFVQNQFQLSVPQFEELVKRDIAIRKLRSAIEGGVTVSNAELMDAYRRENVKVKFDYAVLTLDDVMKTINPTEPELRAYYEKNKEALKNSIPEQRKAAYILIDSSKLANAVKPTNDELQSYYKAHQDEFRVPESVTVSHILIKTPPPGPDGKPDQKAVDAARAKAQDILNKIKAGGNFAELAKKYSEDPGSAKNGGSLGPITRGRTAPEFDKAAFSLAKGQTSDLVQTVFGFHIIHVDDKTQAHLKTLDEVKSQIEPIVARQKAQAEMERLARTVEAESRTKGMEKAAADHGLQVTDTGFFARTETLPVVGNAAPFMDAVFTNKPNSPPVAVSVPQGMAVVQTVDSKPPATPTFEEAKEKLAQQFKQERAQTLLVQRLQELSDRARAEHNLKAAAKAVGATVKTSDLVTPSQQVPDLGAMSGDASVVFDLNKGEISNPVPAGRGGAVMQVLEKQEPSPADFDKSKQQIRDQLLAKKRNEVLELFVSNLRQRMEKDGQIKINEKLLAQVTKPSSSPE